VAALGFETCSPNPRPSLLESVLKPRAATEGRPYSTFGDTLFPKHIARRSSKPARATSNAAIAVFIVLAMGMNFLGFNPMKALVFSGIVQGFSTPPLLLLIMLMTNNRNHGPASIGLIVTWFI
jgi:Mn2+/Fe2+ NRAMP family transporter